MLAAAYDTPILGWQGRWVNTLRLWGAKPTRLFDLDALQPRRLAAAAEPEALARTISRVLYPDDTTDAGKELRLKQEYFFTAASLRDIVRRFETGTATCAGCREKVAIQLNDTHPAIAGPELVRLLVDERGMGFDEAIETARRCLNYTNHTLLPEALERWRDGLMGRLLPRHMQIIERIDDWLTRGSFPRPRRSAIVATTARSKMGELAFIMAHRVNGVSALHTELMKRPCSPSCTGCTPSASSTRPTASRRAAGCWRATRGCSSLITEAIGAGWVDDLEQLERLEPLVDDAGFRERFAAAKRANKQRPRRLAGATRAACASIPTRCSTCRSSASTNTSASYMNMLEAIALWQEIRDNPGGDWTPRVKIFGGKAAPGYVLAKEIIQLINEVAPVLNNDPITNRYLQRRLSRRTTTSSMAERLIPAADLSEQISTAGMEASGTGNMKFALNGALTIGTLDGANVEIREHVGAENFFLFGMTAEQVIDRRATPDHAARAIAEDPRLARAVAAIADGAFSPTSPAATAAIAAELSQKDYFLVCSDFDRLLARPARGGRRVPRPGRVVPHGGAEHRALGLVLVRPDDPRLHARNLAGRARGPRPRGAGGGAAVRAQRHPGARLTGRAAPAPPATPQSATGSRHG